jgi:hypothetical protein
LNACVVFDVEAYPNHWVVGFLGEPTGANSYQIADDPQQLRDFLGRLEKAGVTLVGYNSAHYDVPIIRAILAGRDHYGASEDLINKTGARRPDWLEDCPEIGIDHIDLSARLKKGPAFPSLKVAAANLGTRQLQDLPFPPGKELTDHEWRQVCTYNDLDLQATRRLLEHFADDLAAMAALSGEVGFDARSLPAQKAAELLLENEYRQSRGRAPRRMPVPTSVCYDPPACVRIPSNPFISAWYERIAKQHLPVRETDKKIEIEVQEDVVSLGDLTIKLGQGGLHSKDEPGVYYTDDEWEINLIDASSYYPSMIAQFGFMPRSYGQDGLSSFRRLLALRLERKTTAKAAPDPTVRKQLEAASTGYKLALNAVYGKFKSPFSSLFDPQCQIAVALTGQLLLIDLIEQLQAAGCEVLSANTDGLFVRARRGELRWLEVLEAWQSRTGLRLEREPLERLVILATNSFAYLTESDRDVRKGELDGKLEPGRTPNALVVRDAIANALLHDVLPEQTIYDCTDPVRFCSLTKREGQTRRVTLVGTSFSKDGLQTTEQELPGRVVRWYKAKGSHFRLEKELKSGKRQAAPKADSIALAMDLSDGQLPDGQDRNWYIGEARKIIQSTPGYRHRSVELLQGHADATLLHDIGLTPVPKRKKMVPPGLSDTYDYPTYLWDWHRFDAVGVCTGTSTQTLVLDVDDPVRFQVFVDKGRSPLLTSIWEDLADCLVSYHGMVRPEQVRTGQGRGKLIFRCDLSADHPLVDVRTNEYRADHGVEIFFRRGFPTVLGQHPSGEQYQLDGQLTEAPAWLIDLLSPKKQRPKAKPKKSSTSCPPETCLDELVGNLEELEPTLDRNRVGYRRKELSDGRVILVGRCPFEHDSGNSASDDLSAGFNQFDEPFISCKHASCGRIREINRELKQQFRPSLITQIEGPKSPIDLSDLGGDMLDSLGLGNVSCHIAFTGSGKTHALAQAAAVRFQRGQRTLLAVPSTHHAEELASEIRKHVPEAFEQGAVSLVIGQMPNEEEESEPSNLNYPIDNKTRIIITSHQQLNRRGFSQYIRAIWPLLEPNQESNQPPFAILIDECSKFIAQLRKEYQLQHRASRRNNHQGGTLIPLNECPKSSRSGACHNCILRHYGVQMKINWFGIREARTPDHTPLDPETGSELTVPQLPLKISAADFETGPRIRVGDTLSAARVTAFRGKQFDPALRRTMPLFYWRPQETLHEPPEDSLAHMLDFAFRPTLTWEHPYDSEGHEISSDVLAERHTAGDKEWDRGVVFPRLTCEVPRLQFIDLMPLEQLGRFSSRFGSPVLFTGATPLPDDMEILRAVFENIEVLTHPYPNRQIMQVLLVFPDGKYGTGGLIGQDGKLVTSSLEDCGPQLIFTATRDKAEYLYRRVRDHQDTVEFVVERDRVMDARKPLHTDRMSRAVISYSRGVIGVGSNRMLGLRTLVVNAAAFRSVGSFTPEEITTEAYARMRAEERTALIMQNVGRGLRGEAGKTLVLIVFNADPELRAVMADAEAILQGSQKPPVVLTGEDLEILLDQAQRWLEANGGPLPPPDPTKASRRAGRPSKKPKPTPAGAMEAVKNGMTYRDYAREHHLERLSPAEQAVIKDVFAKNRKAKKRVAEGTRKKS